jgi:hypothetical protein
LSKNIDQSGPPEPPGMEMLRFIAGLPHQSFDIGRRQVRNRTVQIQRDANGNVIGSVERIEETDITDFFGNWSH